MLAWEKHWHDDPQFVCVYLPPGEAVQYAPFLSQDDRHWMAARACRNTWRVSRGIIEVYDMSGELVSRWKPDICGKLRRLP